MPFANQRRRRWPEGEDIALNAILQVVWFPLAPLWALLIILLDVVLIYHLTARWEG